MNEEYSPPTPPIQAPPPLLEESRPPRIWPVFVVMGGVLPAMIAAIVLTYFGFAVYGLAAGQVVDARHLPQWLEALMLDSPLIMLLMLVPIQLVFFIAAFAPALLSPEPLKERLGFVAGRTRWLMWPVYLLATLFIMFASAIALEMLFDERSPVLENFARTIAEAPLGVFLAMLLFISIAPGVFEEALFRGYIQRRLLKRWSPWLAIGLTSVVFAIVHMDPQHVLGVLPIGIWLGILAWRTGSIWPGVFCHIGNNAVASLMSRAQFDETYTVVLNVGYVALLFIGAVAFLVSIPVLVIGGRTPSSPAAEA